MKNVYSIKDNKAQAFSGLYVNVNDALMVRDLDSGFKTGKMGLINQYPEDFSVYQVAIFDDCTGEVKPALRFVKNFSDFSIEEDQENGNGKQS